MSDAACGAASASRCRRANRGCGRRRCVAPRVPDAVEFDCDRGSSRLASWIRTRTRCSARRATRSRSCARPACRTWRSRGAAVAFMPRSATCAAAATTSCSRWRCRDFGVSLPAASRRWRSSRATASRCEDELRSLRVIRRLADSVPLRVVATCLGAHEIPLEFRAQSGGTERWIGVLTRRAVSARGRRIARDVRRRVLRTRRVRRSTKRARYSRRPRRLA